MIEKISKICWNDFKWSKPSGTNGKSPSSEAYENKLGYGHEEWLFDKSKIIKGFHYAFLQPLNLITDKHVGNEYKIWLYTVTGKEKFLVGSIEKAICISKDESIEIFDIYRKNGWLRQMVKDLESAGINPTNLKETSPDIFFNLKFKVRDIKIFDDFPIISANDKNITTTRYKLLDKISEFTFEEIKQKGTESYSWKTGVEIFVDPYHNKIQNVFSKLLQANGIYRNIKVEERNIDVQATLIENGEKHFFEIKTDTPKNNIRQAIGQLFEYSMYPDRQEADKLIIVGDSEPSKEVKKYIAHLRDTLSLNIYYRWVDMDNEKLSSEI